MDWIDPKEARRQLSQNTGKGVRIAILDSGIEAAHSEFSGRNLVDDFLIEPGTNDILPGAGEDPLGHGTAVASLVWKTAPDAELGSFRVLRNDLKGRSGQIATAARAAIAKGYQILNCSFGCCISGHLLFYKEWVDLAYQANTHIVAASSGLGHPEWPAQLSSVMSVESDPHRSGELFYHQPNSLVEFSLPAVDCPVAWSGNSQRNLSGSSFSAAILSGLVARILQFYPQIQPLQLKVLFAQLATPEKLSSPSVRKR